MQFAKNCLQCHGASIRLMMKIGWWLQFEGRGPLSRENEPSVKKQGFSEKISTKVTDLNGTVFKEFLVSRLDS